MDFGVFTLVAMWLLVHPKLPSPLSTTKENLFHRAMTSKA